MSKRTYVQKNNPFFFVSSTSHQVVPGHSALINSEQLSADGIQSFANPDSKYPPQILSSLATHSTELMRWRVECQTHSWCQIQLIPCDSRCRSEPESLEDGGEEEEELHLSQTLPQTHPAAWQKEVKKRCDRVPAGSPCVKDLTNTRAERYLLRTAWRRLASWIYPPHPGSGRG